MTESGVQVLGAVLISATIAILVGYSYFLAYWAGYSKGRKKENRRMTAKQRDLDHWERWDQIDSRLEAVEEKLKS